MFSHCGNHLNVSLYMDSYIGENYWYHFPQAPLAALIFVHCFSTAIHNLVITNTPSFGIIGINMLGNTIIHSVNVFNSGLSPCATSTIFDKIGGGIFLLFQNTPSNIPDDNYSLTVLNSSFLSSCGPISFIFTTDQNGDVTYIENTDMVGSSISVIFGQNSYPLKVKIDDCLFDNNQAQSIRFTYYVGVSGTNVSILSCSFTNNDNDHPSTTEGIVSIRYATPVGGSVYVRPNTTFEQLPSNQYRQNLVFVSDCLFTNNTSFGSSGVSFVSSGNDYPMDALIVNVNFERNTGLISSALTFLQLVPPAFSALLHTTVSNCKFTNNDLAVLEDAYVNDQVNYYNFASVVALHNTRQVDFVGTAIFENNKGTAIYLYSSIVSFKGVIRFNNNYANSGAALGIYSSSFVLVHEGTNMSFVNNTARRRGGAVYVDDLYGIPTTLAKVCFFQYLSPRGNFDHNITGIDIRVYFINNSAVEAGSSIFSPVLDVCSWLPNAAFRTALPFNVNIELIFLAGEDGRQISSDAFNVCFCLPDNYTYDFESTCTMTEFHTQTYPGETINVTVIGTGERYGPVPTIVYTTVHDESTASCSIDGAAQVVHEISNNCTNIQYTLTSYNSGTCNLLIRTDTQPLNPTKERIAYVDILDCPFGFRVNTNGRCDCHPLLTSSDNPAMITKCNLTTQMFRRPADSWLQARNNNGTLTEIIARDYCPYRYCKSSTTSFPLTDPDSQCRYKRSGILCGQCRSGLSSVFGSPQCKICSNAWLSLLVLFALAGIILVGILFALNLTITNGTINGLIFYANVISINETILFPQGDAYRPLLIFISFLNLDLGIETCFYDGMDEYAKIWLEYMFPVYLIIIVAVIIVLARHSSRIQRLVRSNGVPVLSTLIFLSYTKLLRTSSVVLFYGVDLTHLPSSRVERVWAPDANIEFFGFKFVILFVVSLIVFVLLLIPFTVLMLFTKTFLRFRWITKLKPVLDAYQGPFVDPFRFWIGFRLLVRAFLFSTSAGIDAKNILLINTIMLSLMTILQGYFRPFRNFYHNLLDLSFLVNLVTLVTVSLYFEGANSIAVSILIGLTFLMLVALICYHVFVALRHFKSSKVKTPEAFIKIKAKLLELSMYKYLSMEQSNTVVTTPNNVTTAYVEMREPLMLGDEAT
ncbi:uncharacterized protein [Dysidea avara]|uniref:uncharacterized protein n=1 Tax=Dysidea avara TaxID=196820 RepID=UPI003325E2B5